MANLLFLVHRLPYPPNKGDKVRSFHLMEYLARRHRLYLGTFIDDPADEAYVEHVKSYCADSHIVRLTPRLAKIRSLRGLVEGTALSLPYYHDAGLHRWVQDTLDTVSIDHAVVFSSVMATYVPDMARLSTLVDFVDMDSAKWQQYATTHRWPFSWLYQREGQKLLAFERAVAAKAQRGFFVTEAETALFCQAAPECKARVEAMGNGVDAGFFSPDQGGESPYAQDEIPIVFTGAMDYWPNIDAADWFAKEILPRLRATHPSLCFSIVGRSPDPALQALAGDGVRVTGTVADVRPWIAHATVVVAPLRIARGIQNKVLEAMAMGKPVVASTACAGPIAAIPGETLLAADHAEEWVDQIAMLLGNTERAAELGRHARQHVLQHYSWEAHLAKIEPYLERAA